MLIKRIDIINFRQFKKAVIEFSTDSKKNVTLITDENCSGKNTLSEIISWVLYDDTEFNAKEIINRETKESMQPGDIVTVMVRLAIIYNDSEYIITKKQHYINKNNKITFREAETSMACVDGNGISEFLTDDERVHMFRRIMPRELSYFSFFDSQKISRMSKNIDLGNNKKFKLAVQYLTGLSPLLNALNHLYRKNSTSTVLGKIEKKIFSNSMNNALAERYSCEIRELDRQLKRLDAKKEKICDNIRKAEEREEELNNIIASVYHSSELISRYNVLMKEAAELKKEAGLLTDKILVPMSLYNNGSYDDMLYDSDSLNVIRSTVSSLNNMAGYRLQEMEKLQKLISAGDNIENVKDDIYNVRNKLAAYRKEIAETETDSDNIVKEISRLSSEKKKHKSLTDNANKYILYRAYAKKIYDELLDLYIRTEKKTLSELENRINDIFSRIYDENIRITLDNRYSPKAAFVNVETPDDNPEKNNARDWSVIFAFTAGIMAVAGEKTETEDCPLILDLPLSEFDAETSEKICRVIPDISGQPIIFVSNTDRKMAERYMSQRIGAQYITGKETSAASQ